MPRRLCPAPAQNGATCPCHPRRRGAGHTPSEDMMPTIARRRRYLGAYDLPMVTIEEEEAAAAARKTPDWGAGLPRSRAASRPAPRSNPT
jgi:hypothetical protein